MMWLDVIGYYTCTEANKEVLGDGLMDYSYVLSEDTSNNDLEYSIDQSAGVALCFS
jgi:hypothetical protein